MRKLYLAILLSGLSMHIFAQYDLIKQIEKRNCFTVGVLQGGGALIGVDFEFLLTKQFGFQLGGGIVGFGGGLNYHFTPSIRSSFVSLQYFNQGIGPSFAQNAIGATYVFRGERWLTFQIGLGSPLEKGPAMPDSYKQPSIMLLYSIGVYIPY